MISLRFSGDFPLWLCLVTALTIVVLSWRYYRREVRDISARLRWLLPLLRSLALLLILMILSGPILHHRQIIGEPGRLTILLDASRSMELKDQHLADEQRVKIARQLGWLTQDQTSTGDPAVASALEMLNNTPRWQRVAMALGGEASDVLPQLTELHEVRILSLQGEEVVPVQPLDATKIDADKSAFSGLKTAFENPGETTNLSAGLEQAGRVYQGAADTTESPEGGAQADKVAQVTVVITDGQHNSGPSPLQQAQQMAAQGSIVHTLAIGADTAAADLAILRIEHPDSVFRRDQLQGAIVIRDQVEPGKPFVIQVRHGEQLLWQQQLQTQNVAERRVDFSFPLEQVVQELTGQQSGDVKRNLLPLRLEASISPLAEESETANNVAEMRLSAIVQSYRVLLLDGRSRWETRYLRNAFERDEQWTIDALIAGPGTQNAELPRGDQPGQFPTSRERLMEYDLVILGEIEPTLLTQQEQHWVRDFVEIRGGGLIFSDGQRGLLRQLPADTLGGLLPVTWKTGETAVRGLSLQLTDRGASEASLVLMQDAVANRDFWKELPPPQSLIPTEAQPGSEVLAEVVTAGGTLPAMVTRLNGAGRVLYLAFDETWRWRYKVADLWHQRIWNQLARAVMPRPFAVSDDYLSLDTGAVSYQQGETIDVRIRLKGVDGRPAKDATADALVWKDGRVVSTISLQADGAVPGIYRGGLGKLPPGQYEVSVRAAGFSDEALRARSEFQVLPPQSGELALTAANTQLLRQLATAGRGEFWREEQLRELPELLKSYSSGRIVETDTLLWQSYWWFVPVVLLLAVEWMLRRRAGLM